MWPDGTVSLIFAWFKQSSGSSNVMQSLQKLPPNCYNVSASNSVHRGLGTFAFNNFVKMSALFKNTCTFFHISFFVHIFEVTDFVLLLTMFCNIPRYVLIMVGSYPQLYLHIIRYKIDGIYARLNGHFVYKNSWGRLDYLSWISDLPLSVLSAMELYASLLLSWACCALPLAALKFRTICL